MEMDIKILNFFDFLHKKENRPKATELKEMVGIWPDVKIENYEFSKFNGLPYVEYSFLQINECNQFFNILGLSRIHFSEAMSVLDQAQIYSRNKNYLLPYDNEYMDTYIDVNYVDEAKQIQTETGSDYVRDYSVRLYELLRDVVLKSSITKEDLLYSEVDFEMDDLKRGTYKSNHHFDFPIRVGTYLHIINSLQNEYPEFKKLRKYLKKMKTSILSRLSFKRNQYFYSQSSYNSEMHTDFDARNSILKVYFNKNVIIVGANQYKNGKDFLKHKNNDREISEMFGNFDFYTIKNLRWINLPNNLIDAYLKQYPYTES